MTASVAPAAAPPARKPLMVLDDALAQLLAQAQPLADTQLVPTVDADGRVLAQSLVSALHVPPQDNSSMDGYAVRCADVVAASVNQPVTLPVSQRIAAGQSGSELQPGTVARIFHRRARARRGRCHRHAGRRDRVG